jgi:hypothetical protein
MTLRLAVNTHCERRISIRSEHCRELRAAVSGETSEMKTNRNRKETNMDHQSLILSLTISLGLVGSEMCIRDR